MVRVRCGIGMSNGGRCGSDHQGSRLPAAAADRERVDGNGWALPGRCLDPGSDAITAAVRELAGQTGFIGDRGICTPLPSRYVPDPGSVTRSGSSPLRCESTSAQARRCSAWSVAMMPNAPPGSSRPASTTCPAISPDLLRRPFPAHRDLLAERLSRSQQEPRMGKDSDDGHSQYRQQGLSRFKSGGSSATAGGTRRYRGRS